MAAKKYVTGKNRRQTEHGEAKHSFFYRIFIKCAAQYNGTKRTTAHISSTRSLIGLKFQTNKATWIRIIKKFHTLFVRRHWNTVLFGFRIACECVRGADAAAEPLSKHSNKQVDDELDSQLQLLVQKLWTIWRSHFGCHFICVSQSINCSMFIRSIIAIWHLALDRPH